MITFYHSPNSRSTIVLGALHAMGKLDAVDLRLVSIPRVDGSGRRDPANPHPEGKVPLLVDDGVEIWERAAILLYLTDRFPDGDLGVGPDDPLRGRYLSWLAWYAGVVEPVLILHAAGIEHPYVTAGLRGLPEVQARLATALKAGPWLVGDRFTTADLLVSGVFLWFRDLDIGSDEGRDWLHRCEEHPPLAEVAAIEAELSQRLNTAEASMPAAA